MFYMAIWPSCSQYDEFETNAAENGNGKSSGPF